MSTDPQYDPPCTHHTIARCSDHSLGCLARCSILRVAGGRQRIGNVTDSAALEGHARDGVAKCLLSNFSLRRSRKWRDGLAGKPAIEGAQRGQFRFPIGTTRGTKPSSRESITWQNLTLASSAHTGVSPLAMGTHHSINGRNCDPGRVNVRLVVANKFLNALCGFHEVDYEVMSLPDRSNDIKLVWMVGVGIDPSFAVDEGPRKRPNQGQPGYLSGSVSEPSLHRVSDIPHADSTLL